jgi:hypothetical protein
MRSADGATGEVLQEMSQSVSSAAEATAEADGARGHRKGATRKCRAGRRNLSRGGKEPGSTKNTNGKKSEELNSLSSLRVDSVSFYI